jgi:cation:H+ antiporter
LPVFLQIGLYLLSFLAIWAGAGLIIRSVDSYSSRLKLSSFAVSFFVLGLLTSIPELSVGVTAIADRDPEIFVGTLLGGVIVIFLFIIPLLAILGGGIKMQKHLDNNTTIFALFVITVPAFFIADNRISNLDGVIMILLYFILIYMIQKKKGVIEALEETIHKPRLDYFMLSLKVLIGIAIVYFASHYIVDQTVYFSKLFNISPFYISLLGLSIGTNLPELSLAVRSMISGKKDIALGDYIGSAAANTFLLGILSIMNPTDVYINGNFMITFFFIIFGVLGFYLFARSKNEISPKEGFILLSIYLLFISIELYKLYS